MAYSELELKAINWWMERNNLRLNGLSLLRQISFKDSEGNISERHISNLLSEFVKARKVEAKERARAKKVEKK